MSRFSPFRYIKGMSLKKYQREIRQYLFLLIIPCIIMIILYIGVRQIVNRQITKQADLIADQFTTKISRDFQDAGLIADLISTEDPFLRFLTCEDTGLTDSFLQIQPLFTGFADASSSIGHIYLIRLSDNKTASDEGLITSTSLQTVLKQAGVTEQEYENSSDEPQFTLLNATRRQPNGISRIYDEEGHAIGVLIITFDLEYMETTFSMTGAAVCTLFSQDVAISSYREMIDPAVFGGDFNWTNPKQVETLVGEPVTCIYRSYDQHTLLVALKNKEYNQPLSLITIGFLVLILAELLIGFLYLYRISKRRYDSIQTMAEALPAQYSGDVAYEDIYQTICTTLTDFQSQKERFDSQKKELALRQILMMDDPEQIQETMIREAELDPSAKAFTVVSFFVDEITDEELLRQKTSGLHDYLSMFIYTTVKELCDEASLPLSFCSDQNIYITVIGSDGNPEKTDQIFDIAVQTNEIITGAYQLVLYTMVSKTLGTVQGLPAAYQETLDLHRFAVSTGSPVRTMNSQSMRRGVRSVLSGDFIRQRQTLLNAILAKKYGVIPSMAEAILATHVLALHDNIRLAADRLDTIRQDLIEGIRVNTFEGFDSQAAAEHLRQAPSAGALVEAAEEEYQQLDRLASEVTVIDYVQIATDYIRENLSDQNLNVSLICEASGVSVQKLTRMFQEKYQMPVGEYVNTCRIEKAKELLVQTDLTVTQITQDVGFTNVNTLTRNFKKREGITPTDYRNSVS